PTPRQAFLEFLKSQESEIKELVEARGLPERFIRGEVKKFVDYWTEPTANGKRQRWELQKTFDYRRRLATWLLKADEWSKDAPEKVIKF
ncbi:MAG: hypothetical protein IT235_07485, partial [Bacteroidia bacterium]|nr:hypothetical protein [Bacteroidia bacterium]